MSGANNFNDSTAATPQDAFRSIVSYTVTVYIRIFVLGVGVSAFSALGCTLNLLSVVVYCRQGVKDSIVLTLLALAIFDFGLSFCTLTQVVCILLQYFAPKTSISLISLQYVIFAYTRGSFYAMSTMVTMYISMERCVSVVRPFHVKGIFTRFRALLVVMTIVLVSVGIYAPAWTTMGLHWVDVDNSTVLTLWLAPSRRSVDLFVDSMTGIFLPTVGQVVISSCSLAMVFALNASVKFKKEQSPTSTSVGSRSVSKSVSDKSTSGTTGGEMVEESTQAPGQNFSNRELKVVRVVLSVATIFCVCNVPVLITSYTRAFMPEFALGQRYYNLYKVIYYCLYFSSAINASVNFIVYYTQSSGFKDTFWSMICQGGKRKS